MIITIITVITIIVIIIIVNVMIIVTVIVIVIVIIIIITIDITSIIIIIIIPILILISIILFIHIITGQLAPFAMLMCCLALMPFRGIFKECGTAVPMVQTQKNCFVLYVLHCLLDCFLSAFCYA